MRYLILFLSLLLSVLVNAQGLRIAAAADLRYAMDEITASYKALHPGCQIEVVYGSSGTAYAQIINGAPFDLYFSADISYPEKLSESGLTLYPPKLYAIGRMVLWSSSIDVRYGIPALAQNPGIKIAIANPEHAPYGQRAIEALKYYNTYAAIEQQLIFGENISQAAQYCLSGNADAGLLALSLALSPAMTNKGNYYLVDEKAHTPLKQAYVILRNTGLKDEAIAFSNFMATEQSRAIFTKYGFLLPENE